MNDLLKWLPDVAGTSWESLGTALRNGLPVPNGFVVLPVTSQDAVRAGYEELKLREKTHFVAVRSASHSVLNLLGPDALVHTIVRFRTEKADDLVLVQRMVYAMWCGKAQWHRKNLRIRANEGMTVLDPDTYLVDSETGKCLK